jgi:hypothetical protein
VTAELVGEYRPGRADQLGGVYLHKVPETGHPVAETVADETPVPSRAYGLQSARGHAFDGCFEVADGPERVLEPGRSVVGDIRVKAGRLPHQPPARSEVHDTEQRRLSPPSPTPAPDLEQ